ncbi:TPM domain-containing protein [Acidicapsa ligni]|uniref:TPM domain-containing protein n=1 Tax=Acidicapsa ligni TaxID=542300 RepID=UPI0021DFB3F1|nr:TPM domain-containing protein [Acidicapsa ligni]
MLVRRSRSALIWLSLSLALVFSALTGLAERVEDLPKPTDYVSDFAHVLSPQTVEQLDRLCSQLDHSKADTQVAIVVLRNLNGDDKADFANRLEEKWKVGKKGSDRGILMLVTVEDRHYWIEVGYGLEGILPDAKVGDIGRLMVPHLRARDYNGAVTTGLVQIANVVAADAKVSLQDQPGQDQSDASSEQMQVRRQPRRASTASVIFRIIIIVLVIAFFGVRGLLGFGLGMFFGGGGGGGGRGGGWGGGGGGDSGGGFGGFGGGESGGGGAGGDY